jgi:uncharacterized OB-fold protein
MNDMNDQAFFWEGVDQGRLLVQQCVACSNLRHPPVPMCPKCRSLNWAAHELCGRGRVAGWIVSKHPTRPDESPRTVVLVDLEEGVRLVSNMDGNAAIEIGSSVEIVFKAVDGLTLPNFRLAAEATQ